MSIAPPLVIANGRLVLPEGEPAKGSVRCEGGRIAAIGDIAPEPGDAVVDANGALIAPGLVDLGVFAIDKPAFHFGGITRAALMPDQSLLSTFPRGCVSPRNRASQTSGCIRWPPRRLPSAANSSPKSR